MQVGSGWSTGQNPSPDARRIRGLRAFQEGSVSILIRPADQIQRLSTLAGSGLRPPVEGRPALILCPGWTGM
jgi:hypothetical protein